jgi:SWI/SNF-related matrix-associated actin-dependent regulator of chromatin subfamily A member 5
MGLGKTIQTLAFLSRLKAEGLPGPHLVVTPLAVLQNWANELKRFTPQLSFVKIHGGANERDRLLSSPAVLEAEYDIYLTTYDTLRAEEAFFTEAFLFHTITIDEGHRLKNEASSLCASLARLPIPFRLLLTGTPLQNNLHELWALLAFILPNTLSSEAFDGAARHDNGQMDRSAVAQARALLESLMVRRVKSEVETSLRPKIEFVLKPPLTPLQREWYRTLLQKANVQVATPGAAGGGAGGAGGSGGSGIVDVAGEGGSSSSGGGGGGSSRDGEGGLLSISQLQSRLMQLQKVCNHPKAIALTVDRERAAAAAMHAAAAGSAFIKLPPMDSSHLSEAARADEAVLRGLTGEKLVASSGKLAMLDRLLVRCKGQGSRALLFSQYTLTLDVLEEYVNYRWGALGDAYFRLDGTTNRIAREMDMRSFNAPSSRAFLYLISTRAGGQGINLATADTVVLYDTCYNPQVDLQAQDRAHRIGQTKQVKIYRLISPSTFEERVLLRARQKLLLDALVIKKTGEGGAGVDLLAAEQQHDEGDEAADLGKLSMA